MKRKTKPGAVRAVGLGVVGLTAMPSAHATTQITFGGFPGNNTDISTIANYGGNVSANSADYTVSVGVARYTGTPNIALTWGVGYQTYTDWDGRGNVAQLDFNAAAEISLTLTPEPGYGVEIRSFDLDEWAGGGSMSINWEIFDIEGTLASGVWTRSTGGRDTIPAGFGVGSRYQPLTLRFTRNSGTGSYVALDNLTFDQVPEPSTVALGLFGLGLGAVAMRRRQS